MNYFKSLALAAAIVAPVTVPAFAADAIRSQPIVPEPVAEATPVNTWEGGYTGIYLGGASNILKNDALGGSARNNNVKIGAYAGWNFQNDNFVYGVEGDAGLNNMKFRDGDLKARGGFDGSLRARLGYDMGTFMPYVTGGLAGTQLKFTDGVNSDKKFRVGYTLGAGAETMLTENISARLEYRFSDFGKKNVTLGNLEGRDVKLRSHDIRIGIGYKF